ncbi:hypothetical protein T08_5434 [Trichinella sp. T8]|nr:hypothetical protein T08_5434 [Trichinella sp. T8]
MKGAFFTESIKLFINPYFHQTNYVRNIQCISYLILCNGYRHMIKSDALHKQIAFYMPIDCHDLKTNGTKEWHNSHDMKLNTSYPGDENESKLLIIIQFLASC